MSTDYGVTISGRRSLSEDAYLWRVNVFLFPFYTMPASDPKDAFLGHGAPSEHEVVLDLLRGCHAGWHQLPDPEGNLIDVAE